jgi:hypothetical protein
VASSERYRAGAQRNNFPAEGPPEEDGEFWVKVRGVPVLCRKITPPGQERIYERTDTDAENSIIVQSCANQHDTWIVGKNSGAWYADDADDTLPEWPLFPERIIYNAQTGQHQMATYQRFCGPQSCTIRSEVHLHYKCAIVGCKYVGTKSMASKHSTDHGQNSACNQLWRLSRARRWFPRNIHSGTLLLALSYTLIASLV